MFDFAELYVIIKKIAYLPAGRQFLQWHGAYTFLYHVMKNILRVGVKNADY